MVVGIVSNGMFKAAINTSASFSLQHNFPKSFVYGRTILQGCGMDDDGGVDSSVIQFVKNGVVSNVDFVGVFVQSCTSITYQLSVNDAAAKVLCETLFLG
jgi:hypothetical protein